MVQGVREEVDTSEGTIRSRLNGSQSKVLGQFRESDDLRNSSGILLKLSAIYQRFGLSLLLLSAFLLPIKLSLFYATAIPLILLWLIRYRAELPSRFFPGGGIVEPYIAFLFVLAGVSIFGVNPIRSFSGMPSIFFFPILALVAFDLSKESGLIKIALSLVIGQALASLDAVIEACFDGAYHRLTIGMVTQSGQITLTLLLSLGLIFWIGSRISSGTRRRLISYPEATWGIVNFLILSTLGFADRVNLHPFAISALAITVFVSFGSALFLHKNAPIRASDRLRSARLVVTTVLVPLIASALLMNLKRGPWSGVVIGALILMFLYSRKVLLPISLLLISLLLFVTPVRDRLQKSEQDFFIAGGRSVIWQIGEELALKYPLGIGYDNSGFLRNYSKEIPRTLKHFHNNLLNITVEAGWLGVAVFCWWIISILKAAFTLKGDRGDKVLAHSIGCAIVAWQIAGLVEYNFGDGEVVCVSYILIGLLLRLVLPTKINPAV